MRKIRMNIDVLYTFVIISFLNRSLNPFIYASQYEVVRRTWTPLIEFLRVHVPGIRQLAPPAATRIGSASASVSCRQTETGQELPMSTKQKENGDKSVRQSKTVIEAQPQLRTEGSAITERRL